NLTGPIEIPDHVLVRQTVEDTLHEALDIDGLTALLQRIEAGEVDVHCCETTEASVLSHEIVTARPFAFLDDEEFQNRRTNAVHLRRGLSVDLSSIGALDASAVDLVQAEIIPEPSTADDLHDLLMSLVRTPAREAWRPLWDQLLARGRGRVLDGDGVELWCTTEAASDAVGVADDEAIAARVVRGHLELAGITTVGRLAEGTGLPPSRIRIALALLEREGFALQGSYSPAVPQSPDGLHSPEELQSPETPQSDEPEWVARRLLARMHSYSRRARRNAVPTAASAQDFMRFLLRWQHVAPGTQLAGEHGLVSLVEQLQGFEAASVAWEPELLARRMTRYDPAWLDRLCHDGDTTWLRLGARPGLGEGVPAAPSKATPIAVVFRGDLGWLIVAARRNSPPDAAVIGATAELIEVLASRGACFATELVQRTRRLPDDVERGLWDGVARGLIMCDGFGAIRARVAPRRSASGPRRMSRLGRGAPTTVASAGRWALVPGAEGEVDPDDLAETVAEQLLRRWGIVFRDLVARESFRLPWREVQWALRRLEDRGLVRGGRFVAGFGGEQFALSEAAEQLATVAKTPKSGQRVIVNATDPLNLVGSILPGDPVPAVRTNTVTYLDGVPVPHGAEAQEAGSFELGA
ncbi:MAG: hypothetical protein J2O47_05700, partial [Acidimicrobiaceae bacterium]|nr:hypothetical protein [Acidimicrobiaceae bacterium]